MYVLKPKRLAQFLRLSFENGNYRLTYREIAFGILTAVKPTKAEVALFTDEIRRCWHAAEKHLRRKGVCTILVTKFYFDNYHRLEPKRPNEIALCIAGGGMGQGAFGVRLLSMKGMKNDPMALAYFAVRTRSARGMVAAIEDRAAIEWKRGKLTKPVAKRLVDNVGTPALPEHQAEFDELMRGEK